MDIADTYKCNLMNLAGVARYLGVPTDVLVGYYEELREDEEFLNALNRRMETVRSQHGFEKGIFRMGRVPSIDWFAFERVLLYVLVRHRRPRTILETGVFYGGNTAFLLQALARNGEGRLLSIDFPDSQIRRAGESSRHPQVGDSELYDEGLRPGFLVPEHLEPFWELVEGDSLAVIPTRPERFDLYVHDSDHSYAFLKREMAAARMRLMDDALILVDDIDWSNAFYEFCAAQRLYPLLLTDNGKDDLRVRIGLAWLGHPNNMAAAVTGVA